MFLHYPPGKLTAGVIIPEGDRGLALRAVALGLDTNSAWGQEFSYTNSAFNYLIDYTISSIWIG
jgi:hypothetical protein